MKKVCKDKLYAFIIGSPMIYFYEYLRILDVYNPYVSFLHYCFFLFIGIGAVELWVKAKRKNSFRLRANFCTGSIQSIAIIASTIMALFTERALNAFSELEYEGHLVIMLLTTIYYMIYAILFHINRNIKRCQELA